MWRCMVHEHPESLHGCNKLGSCYEILVLTAFSKFRLHFKLTGYITCSLTDRFYFFFLWNSVSFEHVDLETNKERFWSTLGSSIILDAEINIDFESASAFFGSSDDLEINSHDDFLRMFRKNNWNNNIVLLIDEFDKLYEANENVRSSCLEIFLGMKNSRNNYAIWSIVAIGTFSILFLKSEKTTTSPFNVDAPFSNPNFTWEQVQFLYNEFANDFSFTIDPKIIKDIYKRTSGYVKLC